MKRPKPSDVPTWALSGERVEPPEEKKAHGFVPGEKAHAQYFNWLFHAIGDWLHWINGVFPVPVSRLIGRRYLAIGSDTQVPGLEFHATGGQRLLGEVQWSDPACSGADKRVAAIVGGTDGEDENRSGRLDFHVRRGAEDALGASRMSLDASGLQLDGHLRTNAGIIADGILQFRPPHSREDYVDLPPGSQVFDATGRTWVGVLVHELNPQLAGITGGTRGQLLFCELVHGEAGIMRDLRLRHQAAEVASPHDRFLLQGGQDVVVTHSFPSSIVCLFVYSDSWRLLSASL